MHKLRQKASGRAVRFSDGDITDRVVAMPIPYDQKLASLMKNNITDVTRFLDKLHPNHYRIYNLCLEGKYSYEKFQGRVSEYQFSRNGAPSLALVVNFVNDAADWLDHHPRNVCVVHCNNGKGRTGTMVASLLLKIGVCSTPSEALQLFANRRTIDGKAVVKHPSQLRYVTLYDQFRKGALLFSQDDSEFEDIDVLKIDGRGIGDATIEKNIPRIITGIRLSSAPQFRRSGGCSPWFSIDQKGKRIFFSPPLKGIKNSESVFFSCLRIIVAGDIRLDFYHKNFKTKMFSCSLHTAAFKVSAISLPKRELDLAWQDKSNKHFPPNFKLEIFLAAAPDFDENDSSERGSTSMSTSNNHDNEDGKEDKTRTSLSSSTSTSFASSSSSVASSTSRSSTHSSIHSSAHSSLSSALTRMRASTQLATIATIGSRCARCREILGENDFYLEVSGVSIHWDCLQCNECGKVFGEMGTRDSVVLMKEQGGIGCVHCGDFKNFFPSCARCGEAVTGEEDCCVSIPLVTTYWHSSCFSCVRCAAPLQFCDEDALWRIEPSTGMPICFFHPSLDGSNPSSPLIPSPSSSSLHLPSPPPPSPASANSSFLGQARSNNRRSELTPFATESFHDNAKISSLSRPLSIHQSLSSARPSSPSPNSNNIPQAYSSPPSPSPARRSHAEPSLSHSNSRSFTPPQHASAPHLAPSKSKQSIPESTHPSISPSAPPSPSYFAPSLSSKRCSGCEKEVIEGAEVLIVGGKMWHPTCLKCAHCHIVLSPSHRVTEVEGKLFCREDFEKLFGVSCGRCRTLIQPGASYFNTGSLQFHSECFSCIVCERQLSDGIFFVRGESPLCEQHKNHIPTSPTNHNNIHNNKTNDSGEEICHSVASLINTAKNALMALEDFDKKTFVVLAKQLASVSKEFAKNDDESLSSSLSSDLAKAHEELMVFCLNQLSLSSFSPSSFFTTCHSLDSSRLLLQTKISK